MSQRCRRARIVVAGIIAAVVAGAWAGAAHRAVASGALTQKTADAAFRALVLRKTPDAVLPSAQQPYCPLGELIGMQVECVAEYHVGTTWVSIAAILTIARGAIHLHFAGDTSWTRRWAPCLRRPSGWAAGGIMESNNDCGLNHFGGDDWYMASELYYAIWTDANGVATEIGFAPQKSVGSEATDTAGYALAGYRLTGQHGNVYTYSDVVGDAFRYEPTRCHICGSGT